ncbi:MAG: hypothetical protein MJZ60_06825 [Bacteroidaceae bacterium]|nr:hypothetical protein [Bacteroidaceae bacterium]
MVLKEYVIPSLCVVELDDDDVIAATSQSLDFNEGNGEGSGGVLEGDFGDAKREHGFGGSSVWDNEW